MSQIEQIQVTETGALARGKLGTFALTFLGISASGPMIVIAGAFGAILAISGNVGAPWAYLGVGIALVIWMVGYNALVRRMGRTSAAFATYTARGLGGAAGSAASLIALVSYNGIQIGLYGLFGFSLQGFAAAHASWAASVTWWEWDLIVWAVIAVLGWLKIEISAKILAVFLTCELFAALLFDIGSFAHPAGGSIVDNLKGVSPQGLFSAGGIGAVLALVAASYVGIETPPNFAEEARDPAVNVPRSTYWSAALTAGLYAVSLVALIVHMGPTGAVNAARDPQSGIPFSLIQSDWGAPVSIASNFLLLTSMFAAMLSFHSSTARYFYVAGRERTLPAVLGRINVRSEAPSAGSLTQSLLALVSIVVFAALKLDPFAKLFAWYTYVGGFGVMLLMFGTSIAAIAYFARRSGRERLGENPWQRFGAPAVSGIVLAYVCVILILHSQDMLGVDAHSALRWILPLVVLVPGVIGLLVGAGIRASNPRVYAGIGYEGSPPRPAQVEAPAHTWAAQGAPEPRHSATSFGQPLDRR